MLLENIYGKSVITLKEGKKIATVGRLLFNRKNKALEFVVLDFKKTTNDDYKFISFKSIEGIGDYALVIDSENVVEELSLEEFKEVFSERLTEIVGEFIITIKGNKVGLVKEISVSEDGGKLIELYVESDEQNLKKICAKEILTLGKDVIVINDRKEKSSDENSSDYRKLKEEDALADYVENEVSNNINFEEDFHEIREEFLVKKSEHFSDEEFKGVIVTENDESDIDLNFQKLDCESDINSFDLESDVDSFDLEPHKFDDEKILSIDSVDNENFVNDDLTEKIASLDNDSIVGDVKDENSDELNYNGDFYIRGKDDIEDLSDERSILIKRFIEKQRNTLVGKKVTNDIIGISGNVLVNSGEMITIDIFDRVYKDSIDSILEMAMFSE
ncbi:MAG: PRC-barrel domain-containing protein [Filifactoraceae bacterium]